MNGEKETDERAIIPYAVTLPGTVSQAVEEWNNYQELTRQLLEPTDYQAVAGKRFKKKSAWRKYARAFNLTDRVTYEEIIRDERGFPVYARIRVTATATNGRAAEADHECHVTEHCCPNAYGERCDKQHQHCNLGCDGKKHWSHPGDIPATATTRAKNRAISDLIGAGEVSAEEMVGQKAGSNYPTNRPPAEPQRKPEPKPQPARGQQTDPTPGQGSPKDISNPIIGYIQDVQVKKGGEGEGTWTRFGVQIGAAIFGTFDTGLGRLAEDAAEHGRQVKLGWVRQGRYLNIESLSLVEEGESEDEIPEFEWEDVDNADQ